MITMERGKKTPARNTSFWFAFKKARIQAKEVDMAAKNNFVGAGEPAVTFQSAMRLMLAAGQMFGLNPVQGIWEKDTARLRFSLLSWVCGYSLLSLAGQAMVVALCVVRCFTLKIDISTGTSVVFYGSSCLTTALFLRVAARWPALCRRIARTELVEPCHDRRLASRCNATVVTILLLAMLEHLLAIIAGIAVAKDCDPDQPLFEAYITRSFPWVFDVFTFNNFLGALTQFLNLQSTFNWNFTDLFIICISYYLTSCFEQVNRRIYAVRGKYTPSSFWRVAREDYCRLAQLVRRVDSAISAIVFVSFANNLYFICLQLFHTLENGLRGARPHCNRHETSGLFGGHEHAVYFVYSFAYLMARSLAVSLLVARVHSAARAPAPALYDVPSPVYCVEVQRFIDQVTGETIALSGLQFFNVTRGLVLTVAGTIVTYELVLVQFNDTDPDTSRPTAAIFTSYNHTHA